MDNYVYNITYKDSYYDNFTPGGKSCSQNDYLQ